MRLLRRTGIVTIAFLLWSGAAIASTSYKTTVDNSGPIAYWRLGETSGTTAYPTMGSYVGTYKGSPKLGLTGLIINDTNKAPGFDGINNRVTANGLTSRTKTSWSKGYTLEAWVMTTTTSAEEHILAFNTKSGANGLAIFRDEPTNKFKFHECESSSCATAYSKTTPVAGKIYQVVVTVNGSNRAHLYVNGSSQASFTSKARPLQNGFFTIGAEYDCCPTPTSFWKGKIDEVAVYNHALTATQVASQWNAGH
ncbi:MAG: hypothetical protein QOH48_1300 [Actinomycetota bacterium]|jgi:hypothetical protein|nr:hypothetical protein [Actinomycetota bacterium]